LNIKDVAKMAGVSISTISRVINNTAYVSPDVRKRVEAILEETGYRPNSLARELLRNKTDTIGVILPRIDLGTFASIFDGISSTLIENGYNILLANTRDFPEEELRYLNLFEEKRVDGILYFATGLDDRHEQTIAKMRMPIVIVGQSGEKVRCPSIYLDSFNAAKDMVSYLVSLGHRRIGCLAVPDHDENVGTMRRKGYLAALKESGIKLDPDLVVIGDFEYDSGERGAKTLMEKSNEKPTAIFCITDRLAISTSGWLIRNGYRVPEDVSVACIDDPSVLSYCNPSVTTMSFDYLDMGKQAARMIIDRIDGHGGDEPAIVMPYTLRTRESTRARG